MIDEETTITRSWYNIIYNLSNEQRCKTSNQIVQPFTCTRPTFSCYNGFLYWFLIFYLKCRLAFCMNKLQHFVLRWQVTLIKPTFLKKYFCSTLVHAVAWKILYCLANYVIKMSDALYDCLVVTWPFIGSRTLHHLWCRYSIFMLYE